MKMRARWIIVLTATLLLAVLIMLPQISEAGRAGVLTGETLSANPASNLNPTQDQKGDITVVASYHNDTSIPLRDMKPQPVFSKGEHEANENPKIPHKHKAASHPV